MRFEKGNPGGGRPKGAGNKCKQEIRLIIQNNVNFEKVVTKLKTASNKGNMAATKLLFEYGFGRPINVELTGKDGEPIQYEQNLNLTDEDRATLTALANAYAESAEAFNGTKPVGVGEGKRPKG